MIEHQVKGKCCGYRCWFRDELCCNKVAEGGWCKYLCDCQKETIADNGSVTLEKV